jgi:hypothetical protein
MAHAYNTTYSGGRDQEDLCQPGQIVHKTLSQKKNHNKGLVEWLKVLALSSNPNTAKIVFN